jgi:hypothetical protein
MLGGMEPGPPMPEPEPPPIVAPQAGGADRVVPRCATCGYELTGLRVDGACPECGAPVWSPAQGQDPYLALGVTSLVCGVLSLVACLSFGPFSVLPAGAGIVTGEIAVRKYRKAGISATGRGLAVAGRITSWIGMALGVVIGGIFAYFIALDM